MSDFSPYFYRINSDGPNILVDFVPSRSGVIVLNSSLSLELKPEEEEEEENLGASGGGEEEDVHLLFSTSPLEGAATGGCGVSHSSSPPVSNWSHARRVRRT